MVKAKEKRVEELEEELREHTERVKVMQEHLRNVQQELSHTQSLCESKAREIETEDHLKRLCDRELERVNRDTSTISKDLSKLQDALNSIQNDTFSGQEKLEEFKQSMNWNQEELLQWSLAAKQKDEDQEALERYKKMDNVKIKQLTLRLEKVSRDVKLKKQELSETATETQTIQIELDKTAEEYRRLHYERQDLIRQWDEAKQAIQRRDELIAEKGEEVVELGASYRSYEMKKNEHISTLGTEQSNNKQVETKITVAERSAEKTRKQLHTAGEGLNHFQDEIFSMRNELTKANSELNQSRRTIEQLHETKEKKEIEIIRLEEEVERTKRELDEELSKSHDLSSRSKQVDDLHARHEKDLQDIEKDLRSMKEEMFKESHDLFALRKQEANLIALISSSQGSSRNLQARIHELDQRSLKQQEMLYNIEFQVQMLERKVARASGKRSVEETLELNKRITELKASLERHTSQHHMLTGQLKRLQDDLRRSQKQYSSILVEIEEAGEKISRLESENESATVDLVKVQKKKSEVIVRHDMQKLEVKKLTDALTALENETLGLENRKMQLELSIMEREKAIEAHYDVQRAEQKVAEESRHKIAMDLKERQLKVEKLKQKYSVVAGRMANITAMFPGSESLPSPSPSPNDEEGGPEFTQAYYIIAAAQEREELQRKGDALNEQIKKSEREINMLDKTLGHLIGRNETYRKSFQKADLEGEDANMRRRLEEQNRSISDSLFKKKSYLREITTDFAERKAVLGQIRNQIVSAQEDVSNLESDWESLQKATDQQKKSITRNSKKLREVQQDVRVRSHIPKDELSHPDLYAAITGYKYQNKTILSILQTFLEENPHLSPSISSVLREKGIDLYDTRPSTGSSVSSTSSRYSTTSRGSRMSTRSGREREREREALSIGTGRINVPTPKGRNSGRIHRGRPSSPLSDSPSSPSSALSSRRNSRPSSRSSARSGRQ